MSVRHFNSGDPLGNLATRDVLFIDEAAALSASETEQIFNLRNPIIMCGLPNLPERLSLCSDTYHSVTLEPLAPEEVARFVIARLLESGHPRTLFTPEALIAVAGQSSGLMRLVIILAGAATFFAEQRGAVNVTADDVAEAVSMRSVTPEELKQPAALDIRIQTKRIDAQTTEIRLPWLGPAATRGWHWHRIAGTSAFVCASLVLIGATVMAALHLDAVPSLALGEVQSRSLPQMASSAEPDIAASPASQLTLAAPMQLAAASPPSQADATLSPAIAPPSLPETGWAEARTSRLEDSSKDIATLELSARPQTPLSRADNSATTLAFNGPILNETMGQGGQLSLQLRIHGEHGLVDAVFHASKGLIGSGVLTGDIGNNGQITLLGRLMMGPNPYDCILKASLKGERLVGAATFVRATSGVAAHSSFTLSRL
ncbi:MAG: hypothetical protein ACRYGK_13770 [Janthinobacterium lividum]